MAEKTVKKPAKNAEVVKTVDDLKTYLRLSDHWHLVN